MDLTNISSWIVYGILLLFCFIVVYILGFLRGGSAAKQRPIAAYAPPPAKSSLFGGTVKLLIILALTASLLALLFYSALIRSYHAFTEKQLVAIVYCQPVQDTNYNFELNIITILDKTPQDTSEFLLCGDQWALEGNILKWKDWMNFLGLKTMYKLVRVRGRYLDTKKEATEPSSVYALTDEERSQWWQWLYKYGHKLPFVTSAYGNTVFTYPIHKREFKVFVTTSGFMVEGHEGRPNQREDILDQLLR